MAMIMNKKFVLFFTIVVFIFCGLLRGQSTKLYFNKTDNVLLIFPHQCIEKNNILVNYDSMYYFNDTLFLLFPDERERLENCEGGYELQGVLFKKKSFVLDLKHKVSSNFICIQINGTIILLKRSRKNKFRQFFIK
jgi:hypothetical protein